MKRISLLFCLLAALCRAAVAALARPANPFTVTPLETRVLGQNTWLRGGPAALRVIVSEPSDGAARAGPCRRLAGRAENGLSCALFGRTNGARHGGRGVCRPENQAGRVHAARGRGVAAGR